MIWLFDIHTRIDYWGALFWNQINDDVDFLYNFVTYLYLQYLITWSNFKIPKYKTL